MKVSLTRLLKEVKVLESRISKVSDKTFVSGISGNKPPVGYDNLDDFKKDLMGNYQSVKDLITQRNKLKSALVKANADTYFTVNGENMTIAQAIDRKRTIDLEKELLRKMVHQYQIVSNKIEENNKKVEENIHSLLISTFGKDRKVSEEESNAVSVPYRNQHEAVMVDPINLKNKIEELDNSITKFESEVDLCLSEINAKTEVELE